MDLIEGVSCFGFVLLRVNFEAFVSIRASRESIVIFTVSVLLITTSYLHRESLTIGMCAIFDCFFTIAMHNPSFLAGSDFIFYYGRHVSGFGFGFSSFSALLLDPRLRKIKLGKDLI